MSWDLSTKWKLNPGSQPPFSKWWFHLDDDKPYYKNRWFVNQPIKNGGWTSMVKVNKTAGPDNLADQIHHQIQLIGK